MDHTLFGLWYTTLPAYPQIRNRLHTPTGYCCLGVAVELYRGADCWQSGEFNSFFVSSDNESVFPHYEVLEAFGFNKLMTTTNLDEGQLQSLGAKLGDFLAAYNDAGYSFDFIRRLALTYIDKEEY